MREDHQFLLNIKILDHMEDCFPKYATDGSAGLDLVAALKQPIVIPPLKRCIIPTGICIGLPEGYEAQVRPRSGLASKHGITVLNSPGTIDSDYRDEIKVILINLGDDRFSVVPYMKIAQLVVSTYIKVILNLVQSLEKTSRDGGFGSTGYF